MTPEDTVDSAPSEESAPPPPEPPTAAPGPPRRRLTRSRRDRVLAGVAGGLGDYFSIDPVVFRIGFVVVTLLGGSGLLLYLVAWLVIPEEGARRSLGESALRRRPSPPTIGVILLVFAAILLLDDVAPWHDGGMVLPVLLLVAGAVLLLGTRDRAPARRSEQTSEEVREPADDTDDASARVAPSPPPPVAPDAAAPTPTPPPPRRRRGLSVVTRATVSLLLIAGGVAGLLDASGALDISIEGFLAAALVLTGAGLLVTAWWGRAPGLMVLGVALTIALGVSASVDVPLAGGVGDRVYVPLTTDDLRPEYRLFAGDMLLDLAQLDLAQLEREEEITVHVRMTFGEVDVLTPPGVTTIVTARVAAGEATIFGHTDNGLGVDERRIVGDGDPPRLRLDIEVGAGQVTVSGGSTSRVGVR